MFYVVTARSEGHSGYTILGIYSTEKEAIEILELYRKKCSFEILEIQNVTRNMQKEDLLAIKSKNKDGEDFVVVDVVVINGVVKSVEYESQYNYLHNAELLSKTVFSEEIDR